MPAAAPGRTVRRWATGAAVLLLAAGLTACGGKKESKSGQALVSVDGEEITALQVADEMQRAAVPPAQQQAAQQQVVASLVDRQLLINQALKDKLDRDPKVVQAVERAKALILAQAYMQARLGAPLKPTDAQVKQYFDQHPEFFSQRKLLEMRQLQIPTASVDDALKQVIDTAKSLDEVATWMDGHQVKYNRTQLTRSSTDLPPALSAKLLALPKGQLFLLRENQVSTLTVITDMRDAPVDLATATPQVTQFLVANHNKEAAQAELTRLRSAAKIDYLNKAVAPAATPAAAAPAAAAPSSSADAAARGVAGLK
ncbi:peptidyl-prolyl cis-trans isomerase, EpsD family [Duganella sp. FT109W]|uniref:peptidylprolyl isomerase n=1 Tax=Duganella margarita TaxID=2692170 RepID=A0ABW9WLT2_9BURK|nr:peptidyl-prolyl cis-trans isomerase, EpsD family [Duganella margarita]